MKALACVILALAGTALAQTPGEQRDAIASSALKPEAGGPATIGDPVRLNDLSIAHDEVDFTINTTLGPFSLERKFSSSNTWKDSMVLSSWYGYDLQTLNPTTVFQGLQYWWSSLSAYAVEYTWTAPREGEPGKSIDVRDTSGDLYNSGNLLELGADTRTTTILPTTTGAARLIRVVSSGTTASRLVLVKPGIGKTEFEYVSAGTRTPNGVFSHSYALFRLKAVYPDGYATTSASATDLGQPLCSFEYPSATSWKMSAIRCVGGVALNVNWSGTSPSRVESVTDAAGTTWVSYRYLAPTAAAGPQLWQVENRGTGKVSTYTPFSASSTSIFAINGAGLPFDGGASEQYLVTWKSLFAAPVCGSKLLRAVSTENDLNGAIWYSGASAGQPVCPLGDIKNSTVEQTPSGDNVVRVFTRAPSGGTQRVEQSCSWCSTIRPTSMQWSTDSSLPTPTDRWKVDTQGAFTVTSASKVCYPDSTCADPLSLRDTEVTQRRSGATDSAGSNPLSTYAASYTYSNAHGAHEQLLEKVSMPSVLGPPAIASVTWRYDPVTKRPLAVIREGYTNNVGGFTARRSIGTFFFNRAACSGGAPDPLDRVVEVHGPCWVASSASTDCDVPGEPVPLTRYAYHPDGVNGARVATKSIAANYNGGTCSGVSWLTTTFNTYDLRGHVTRETDPNGATHTRTYSGDQLLSETVSDPATGASAQSLYFYHPSQGGMVSSKRLPSGVWERSCYRVPDSTPVAPDCLSGGALSPRLQWVARVAAPGTTEPAGALNILETTTHSYLSGANALSRGGVLSRTDSQSSTATEREVRGFVYDALGRITASQVQSPAGTSLYQSATLFDEEGRPIADGTPYAGVPAACGGFGGGSGSCGAMQYDRLGRLTAKQEPDPSFFGISSRFEFSYDAQGNLARVARDGASPLATYQFDDFGNAVTLTGNWMTAASTRQEFDARGLLRFRWEAGSPTTVQYVYDSLGRQTSQWSAGRLQFSLSYDGQTAPLPGCSAAAAANTYGRLQLRNDTFGTSWYEYDKLGHVTAIRRVRSGVARCSTAGVNDSSHETPDSRYTYTADGRLASMKYPHGRWLFYTYGGLGQQDRVTAISTNLTGPGGSGTSTVLSGISYGLGGKVAGYVLPTTPYLTPVEFQRRGSEATGQGCWASALAPDGSGRFSRVSVSRLGPFGATNVFKRSYTWRADQLAAEATCVLADDAPKTVTYSNDLELRVRSAGRLSANEPVLRGGQLSSRTYTYQAGRRSLAEEDGDWSSFSYFGGLLTGVLPQRSSTDVSPNSWASASYGFNAGGRVTTLIDTQLPNISGATQQGRRLQFTPEYAFGGTYNAIAVNGAVYQYLYDAVGRRRMKVYPAGKTDEFFYEGDQLIEDRGVVTQGVNSTDQTLDEYVWLGGMVVARISTRLDAASARLTSINCDRNDEGRACGTVFIVNDYLPKPVAVIDSAGLLAGMGEYDVFGRVNEVSKRGDAPYPMTNFPNVYGSTYLPNINGAILASFSQPWSGNQRVSARVKYAQINANGLVTATVGVADKTWVTTTAGVAAPPPCPVGFCGFSYPAAYTGARYATTTNWFDVPADGAFNVNWTSDWVPDPATFTGATVKGYEYRRYERGASPTWVPFRFPGQYADAETGLFENWNRFYDPTIGQYLSPDPLPPNTDGSGLLPYLYAASNPLVFTDPNGLHINTFGSESDKKVLQQAIDAACSSSNATVKEQCIAMRDNDVEYNMSLNVPASTAAAVAVAAAKKEPYVGGLTWGEGSGVYSIVLDSDVLNKTNSSGQLRPEGAAPISVAEAAAHELGHAWVLTVEADLKVGGMKSDAAEAFRKRETNANAMLWHNSFRPGRPISGHPYLKQR